MGANRLSISGFWQTSPLILLGVAIGLLPGFISPMIALGASVGIALLLFILRDPKIGFFFICATIPLEVAGTLGQFKITANLPLTIPKVFTVLTLASWGVHFLFGKVHFRKLPWMNYLIAFWIMACLSLLGAEEVKAGVEAIFRFLTTLFYFFLTIQIVHSPKVLKQVLIIFITSTTIAGSYALVQRYLPQSSYDFRYHWEDASSQTYGVEKDVVEKDMVGVVERSSGFSIHPIIMSFNVCLVIVPLLMLFKHADRRDTVRKFVWMTSFLILSAAVVVSYARTGLLLFAFVMGMAWYKSLLRITITQVFILFAGIFFLILFAPEKYLDRVMGSQSYTLKSSSISTRLELQKAALRQFINHPFLGVGYGNRYGIFDYYNGLPDRYMATPHNAYIQMLAQVGLMGLTVLLLFFWFLSLHLRRTIKRFYQNNENETADFGMALLISLFGILLTGFALDLFDKGLPQAWLILGLCGAYCTFDPDSILDNQTEPIKEIPSSETLFSPFAPNEETK